jgi:putative hemolysin
MGIQSRNRERFAWQFWPHRGVKDNFFFLKKLNKKQRLGKEQPMV